MRYAKNLEQDVCKEIKSCICYQLSLEPDENCPEHGYYDPSRCECGRFVKDNVRGMK